MKCILFAGQSLGDFMFTQHSGAVSAATGTYVWNGSGWSAPYGDGAILYSSCLRASLGEDIYLINACVGGSPLLYYSSWGSDYWSNSSGASYVAAVSAVNNALCSVPGLCLDRIEWWQGQTESYNGGYSDMYTAYLTGLNSLISNFRTDLGTGFRFCIWPVGKVHTGSTAQVIRAQMLIANASGAAQAGIEPGPASYDRGYASDNLHLGSPAEYGWMGRRGARNALSYFVAKANAADTIPHYGAGPVVEGLCRHPNNDTCTMFAQIRTKNGHCLLSANPWTSGDTTSTSGWMAAWSTGGHATLPLSGANLLGGWVKLTNPWPIYYPVWVGYQWERTCDASNAIYDTHNEYGGTGQPLLPHALESLESN